MHRVFKIVVVNRCTFRLKRITQLVSCGKWGLIITTDIKKRKIGKSEGREPTVRRRSGRWVPNRIAFHI